MNKLLDFLEVMDHELANMDEVVQMTTDWIDGTSVECSDTLQMDFHVRPKEEQACEWVCMRDRFVM